MSKSLNREEIHIVTAVYAQTMSLYREWFPNQDYDPAQFRHCLMFATDGFEAVCQFLSEDVSK